MSKTILFSAEELINLELNCKFDENLYDFIQDRFSTVNGTEIEYDFEDLSVEEIIDEYLKSYDWQEIWNHTIFDLVYLFCIKLFHSLGIPYNVIINRILNDYEYIYNEFEDIYLNERPCLYPIIDEIDRPIDIIKPNSTGIVQAKWFSCISMLVRDGIESVGNCIEAEESLSIFETYCKLIENSNVDIDELLEEFRQEGTLCFSLQSGTLQPYSEQYIELQESIDGDYESANTYQSSLISKVQFKYIMDAILLEEITDYTADYCQSTALSCNIYDRSGWYEFKIVELTEGIDRYNFNPRYSSTIYISLPTKNDEELVISGLYHWELKLLSLDLPDGQHLMVNSPEREHFNEKDVLEMERYLQELNNNDSDEEEKSNIDNGLTLRLRTKNDLMELLQAGKSGAWKVARGKEKQISRVQIYNWDGSMMLEASHHVSNSYRRSQDNRLIIALNEDAKIIKCNPPFQWVGQNPVNYVDKTSATAKHNLVKDKNIEQNSELLVNQTEIKEPVPHAPEGFAHVSPQLAELCEAVYGEPVRLVHWQMKDDNGQQQFSTLFRECRRGWYFQMLLTQQQGKWSSEHRVLPSFLNLLEPDETVWAELTKSATAKDWYALDEIFLDTLIYPKSRVILAGSDLVGEEVADEAMKNFGFYVPYEDLLPVLLFEAPNLGVRLISYFRHPDEFAKENMVSDRNTDGCEVFDSLAKAQSRLDQKLSYYISEA